MNDTRHTRPVPAGQPIPVAAQIHRALTLAGDAEATLSGVLQQIAQIRADSAADRREVAIQKERLRACAILADDAAHQLNQAHDEITAAYAVLDAAGRDER